MTHTMHSLLKYSLFALCLLASGACQHQSEKKETSPAASLVVKADGTPLREAPGEDGKVLTEFKKGTALQDLGEVSHFMTPLTIQGVAQYEPWLKVKSDDGAQGWVYAGALDFGGDTIRLHQKRFQALLGKTLYQQSEQWQIAYDNAQKQQEVANAYLNGSTLRDSMTRRLPEGDADIPPPDVFWIKSLLPAFEPQLVAEGTAYYLFADYRAWLKKAAQTPEKEDDAFFQFCVQVFPEDSIEYFFPAWQMQTWDYGGSSLLGRGIHLRLLETADRLCATNTPFRSEILRRKAEIINDMTQEGVEYWEKPEKIIRELDTILERNFKILDDADRIALRTRRTHFEAPAEHGLKTGQGAGSEN